LRHITPHRRRKYGEHERPKSMKVGDLTLKSRFLYPHHNGLHYHYRALPFCNRNYNTAMPSVGNIPHFAFIYIFMS
jgi:hypothetical protein